MLPLVDQPEWVCILRTKSFIWSTAVWLGLMT